MKSLNILRLLGRLLAALAGVVCLAQPLRAADSGVRFEWNTGSAAAANAAIMAYLGEPVPPPAQIDAKYTPEGLATAFRAICQKLGYRIETLQVDQAEFPFLVYGTISGRCDHRAIQDALRGSSGYSYGGSTTGMASQDLSYFSLNMVPQTQYPSGQNEAIRRRLMIRLQMLSATLTQRR